VVLNVKEGPPSFPPLSTVETTDPRPSAATAMISAAVVGFGALVVVEESIGSCVVDCDCDVEVCAARSWRWNNLNCSTVGVE
jgi:hypothetical protein